MDSSESNEPHQKRLKLENGHSAAQNGNDSTVFAFPLDDETENGFGDHDITLLIGNVSFKCHKRILSEHSKYFQAMFSSPMRESQAKEVTLQNVLPEAANVLISYMYSSQDELNVDAFNMSEVTALANMLQMDSAVKLCSDLMLENLGPENCLGFMQVAQDNYLPEVYNKTRLCAVSNFSKVVTYSEFCQVDVSHVKNYLSDEYLNTPNELEVFYAVMDWYRSCVLSDEKAVKSVDLQELLESCLFKDDLDAEGIESILQEQVVRQNGQLRLYFENLKKTKMQEGQELEMAKKEKHRKKSWQVLCVGHTVCSPGDLSKLENEEVVERLLCPYRLYACTKEDTSESSDFQLEDFSPIQFDTSREMGFHMCASGTKVYLSGGEVVLGRNTWNYTVWELDTQTKQWTDIGTLQSPRRHHASCCYDDQLVLLGGFGRYRTILDTVECLQLSTGEWSKMSPLRHAEFSPVVALAGDRLVIFKTCIQVYDLCTSQCTIVEWDRRLFPLCSMFALSAPHSGLIYTCQMEAGDIFRLAVGSEQEVIKLGSIGAEVDACVLVEDELYCFQTSKGLALTIFNVNSGRVRREALQGPSLKLSFLAVALVKYPVFLPQA